MINNKLKFDQSYKSLNPNEKLHLSFYFLMQLSFKKRTLINHKTLQISPSYFCLVIRQ